MIKGQVISGKFGEILVRQKSDQEIELGELLIAKNKAGKILLQVYDLAYGSQISQQNLELISGMKLEENADMEFMDPHLRNYTLARLKNLILIKEKNKDEKNKKTKAISSKSLPSFFSELKEVTADDLKFLGKPENSIFLGKLRSGTKELEVPIHLDGEKVFKHHILISGTTGKGKSLDEKEEVLIKTNNNFQIKSIGELVNNNSDFQGSKVLSMNPKNYTSNLKKISKFVKHKAPRFMYQVVTESGREILVTGDHNLYVMRNGKLRLLKTKEISNQDYLPLPLKINFEGNLKELNLFELLKHDKRVFVLHNKKLVSKLKPKKECIKILSQYYSQPLHKYHSFLSRRNRMRITILNKLLAKKLSNEDLKSIQLTDHLESIKLKALFPITKEFLELLGYYIAEGYCSNENCFKISCSEKPIRDDLKRIFEHLNLKYFYANKKNNNVDLGVSSSIFTKILKNIGLGRVSGDKRLPYFFMNLSNKNLRVMLRTYFEGDGGVDKKIKEERKSFKISTTTKSKKLANDLCLALCRVGVFAICKKRMCVAKNTKHKGNWYYRIAISGQKDLKLFLTKIGFKFERKNSILAGKLDYKGNTNIDVIPVDPEVFRTKRLQTGLYQRQFCLKINCCQQTISLIESGKRRPSRDLFNRILMKFDNFKDLSNLLKFRWDRIKEIKKIKYNNKYVYDITVKDNKTFLAGHGGIFVHNSNLMESLLWDSMDKEYCALLVLDPHDEYYGRNKIGLKDHPKAKCIYYTSKNAPTGQRTLKINLKSLRPDHFDFMNFSGPQGQLMYTYYKQFKQDWTEKLLTEDIQTDEGKQEFHEMSLAVVRRQFKLLLDIDIRDKQLFCNGIFDQKAGETTIKDIAKELENTHTVIIDTSNFSGQVELLIGSLITTEIFNRYKHYKVKGELKEKPVISIVLEEAPRVLGKQVLEKGSNIFSTIAREGRKFKVGLTAITQLPSLIPREILANMNTKIILGTEMNSERQAIIESASQDLSNDNRSIASLDVGEAIVTSNFARFALPIKVPYFDEEAKKQIEESKKDADVKKDYSGVDLS